MNKILYIVLLACLFPAAGSGQNLRITYEPGFGFYDMSHLKSAQQAYLSQSPLQVKAVEQFPAYFNHSANVGYYFDKNTLLGINVAYLTTGGRNHLSDYSGEYKLDMHVNAFQVGIESEYLFNITRKLDFYTNLKLGVIKSTFDVTESLILYNLSNQTTNDQTSQTSYFLEPNVGLSYKVTDRISARAGIGFNLDTSSFSNQLIDWTGFRTKIGLAYSF